MKQPKNHTKAFYRKKYKELKDYARKKGIVNPYKSAREFESDYKAVAGSSDNVMRDLKYGLQYNTSYKTALAEYRAAKAAGIKGVKLRDTKLSTTTEFADMHKAEIQAEYDRLRKSGVSGKDAKRFISKNWFGSK